MTILLAHREPRLCHTDLRDITINQFKEEVFAPVAQASD